MAAGFFVDIELDSGQRLQSVGIAERRDGVHLLDQMLRRMMVRHGQLIHARTGTVVAHGPGCDVAA